MPRKLTEFPEQYQKIIQAMPPEMQAAALSEMSFSDFVRLADLRIREAIGTFGPSRYLLNAADRLHESHMWAGCFDPETDSMVPAPEAPAGGIVVADAVEAEALAKAVGPKKKGK